MEHAADKGLSSHIYRSNAQIPHEHEDLARRHLISSGRHNGSSEQRFWLRIAPASGGSDTMSEAPQSLEATSFNKAYR